MRTLFALTVFLGSALLFTVEPLVARLVLPVLGGAPEVWVTCVLFFQAALLAGYLYAHLSRRWLPLRARVGLHLGLLVAAGALLPVALPGWTPPATAMPVGFVLGLLVVTVGAPFVVLASQAPLLQNWYAGTGRADAADPYFLYSASNLGSLLALLAYPLLLEPGLGLAAQGRLWALGFAILGALVAACAAVRLRARRPASAAAPAAARAPPEPLGIRRRLRWIALAAVPSSLMLGVTTSLTTDLAAVPLLWVVPLALYLLTFALVFARRPPVSHRWMVRLLPAAAIALLVVIVGRATTPVLLVALVHLAVFFLAAMVGHGELARDRPSAARLTEFFLLTSVGGVLGGVFNGLVAPLLFPGIAEYPIALVAACLLAPPPGRDFPAAKPVLARRRVPSTPGAARAFDAGAALFVFGVTAGLCVAANGLPFPSETHRLAMVAAPPALLAFLASDRPRRFGLCVAAALLAGTQNEAGTGTRLETERSYFGVHRVTRVTGRDEDGAEIALNVLFHGTTVHGKQRVDPATGEPVRPDEPLAYYHREGSVGRLFAVVRERGGRRFGFVGLGAGALFAYAGAGDHVTAFEIDPLVRRIAESSGRFGYVSAARARGARIDFAIGDARRTLAGVPDASLDLLVLDAFTSDAVPVHLLTAEAGALYRRKLRPGGLLALHVSNRHLDLGPVVAGLAKRLGTAAAIADDRPAGGTAGILARRQASRWAVLGGTPEALAPLIRDGPGPVWEPLPPRAGFRPWTDDASSLLPVFLWRDAFRAR